MLCPDLRQLALSNKKTGSLGLVNPSLTPDEVELTRIKSGARAEMRETAEVLREQAARCERLARAITTKRDAENLRQYAQDLLKRAAEIEARKPGAA